MWIVELIALIVSVSGLLQEMMLLILFRPYQQSEGSNPRVSVLIAMRNEEDNAARCLDSLLSQDYAGFFEIWVADDESEDGTRRILNRYSQKHSKIHVCSIEDHMGNAMGKANAIAHLAREAKGDIFLIMDADCVASKGWVRLMANNWPASTGLVNGFTEVEGHEFQHLEWLHSQGMLHVLHGWKVLTSIGNNMGVVRDAYIATGGYESIPFSLTEDRALSQAVASKGYALESRVSSSARVVTKGVYGWRQLVRQRKRWMSGAVQLPWWIVGLLGIQALYYPAIMILSFINPALGLSMFVAKGVFQLLFIQRISRLGKIKTRWITWFLYEFYSAFMAWFHITLHMLPGRVSWKGREFNRRS